MVNDDDGDEGSADADTEAGGRAEWSGCSKDQLIYDNGDCRQHLRRLNTVISIYGPV